MFVSLNRKIIYSILLLFLITSLIFVYTFYLVYGNKIQEEQLYSIQRNQQYIELLYRNINMSKELRQFLSEHPEFETEKTPLKSFYSASSEEERLEQLAAEQKRISEISSSFDQRYQTIQESLKIFVVSAALIVLAIILLALLITRWILNPINKISAVSEAVSHGNLDVRIPENRHSKFADELDYLTTTFNQMLNNLQAVISEVKDKEQFLQSLIDSIPDGIRVIDKNYNVIVANKAYYKQIGHSQKDCSKCYEASQKINSPCSLETFHCPLHEILHNHKNNVKVVQQFAAFPQRHLSINAAPLKYSGKEKYVVEAIRDLSEDINFSHQQKLSSLGFLSTSIAHEIKNHLGALRMILERLLDKFYADKDDEAEDKKNLLMIYNELVRCIDVPERLLKLTRSVEDNSQQINVKDSITDIIQLLDFEAKSKGIIIELHSSADNIIIRGNDADFKMVTINIIMNAIKAMDADGILNINIKQDKIGHTNISFTDTGIGISAENLNRIFDPFFSEGHDNSKKGTGLGLSIAKSIVEKSGGKISVSSTVGVGSCFTLSFPPIKNLAKK